MTALLEDKALPAHQGLSLTRPAAEDTRCLLGTDTPGAKSHWLACMDASNLAGKDALLGRLGFSEQDGEVRLVEWIHPELAIVSTGEGALHLVSLSPSNQLAIHGKLPEIHKATLRELAINQGNRAQFAAGGYDRGLTLVDLERPEAFRKLEQTGVIGSVAWPGWNQGICPSLTLDDGTLLIYDTRVGGAIPPAFKATFGKKDLFAHARYSDTNLFVGFGDGEIQHIDNRVTDRILHRFQDPYCLAVGHLEYHPARNLLLVSGIPDLTVWRVDKATATASPVCHFGSGEAPLSGDTQVNATFTESGDVLAAGTAGTLSRITLSEPGTAGL
ncbi:WD40 repeat domain-containing protein [Geothrix sp. 21YS21S-2]|uniref:WD40 repeat domain-containing protein n=1 Tax=Geothrix sp. 21YS21S-2 TaxID=3068893 RepID=UPI0027B8E220|nr:WD40 repeat domain-containing protein [Geothrix sp. 21YS21S-2]